MKNIFKKCLLALVLIFTGFSVFAQEYDLYKGAPEEVLARIESADAFIKERKYASAIGALGADDNEFIIYKKSQIFTQYFVQSLMHQMFVMQDLKKGEDIMELRKNYSGSTSMTMYDVEAVVKDFQKKNGKKPILALTLGNFYYDVIDRYGDQWLKTRDELIRLAKENYKISEKAGLYDEYSLFACGYLNFQEKEWDEAEEYFLRLVEIQPTHASAWFNIAVCRYQTNRFDEVPEASLEAVKYETNTDWMSDEYRITAEAYVNCDDIEAAKKILLEGKKKLKDDVNICMYLGRIYLFGDGDYAKAEKEFIAAAKGAPQSISESIDCVAETQNWNNLKALCLKAEKLHSKDYEYTGFVQYVLSQAYLMLGDKSNGLKAVKNARETLTKANVVENYEESLTEIEGILNNQM